MYAFKQILCNRSRNIVAFAIAACFSGTAIAPVFLIQSGNRNAIMTRCLVAEWSLLFQNTKTTFIDCQFSHFGYQYCTLGPRLEHIAVLFRKY